MDNKVLNNNNMPYTSKRPSIAADASTSNDNKQSIDKDYVISQNTTNIFNIKNENTINSTFRFNSNPMYDDMNQDISIIMDKDKLFNSTTFKNIDVPV